VDRRLEFADAVEALLQSAFARGAIGGNPVGEGFQARRFYGSGPGFHRGKLRNTCRRSCSGGGSDEVAAGVFHCLRRVVIGLIARREAYAEEPRLVKEIPPLQKQQGWGTRKGKKPA
jgi:hypothetical protein